jgi:tetratricopeptide (TPR) repeat protein
MKNITHRLAWIPLVIAMLTLTSASYAASPLNKFLDMFSPSNRAYSLAIQAHEASQNNEFDKAIKLCDESISLSPDYDYAYGLRANCYSELGKYELALSDCNTAIQLNPSYAHPYSLRARIYTRKRDLTNSLADCSMAISLAPAEAYSYGLRGWIHMQQGNTNAALEDLTTAIDLDPNSLYPLQSRAWLYLESGDSVSALADARKAISLEGPEGTSKYYIPAIYAQMGKPEEALQYCDKLLEANPEHPQTLNAKAYILCTDPNDNIRNGKEAVRLAELAIKLGTVKNPNFMDTLACAYAETGQFEKAIALQKEVLELQVTTINVVHLAAINDHLKAFEAGKPCREKVTLLPE